MFNTPKAVSLLLSFCISLITVAFLSLVNNISIEALVVAATLSFASSFILIYLTFKFLIFKEIEKVQEELSHLSHDTDNQTNGHQSGNPLKQINQEIVDYVSKKESEIDQLKRLADYRREFIADISHELKTPIFAAQGYVLTLQDGAIDDKKVRNKFLKKAAKSLNRLDSLVTDLLTLSRIESGVSTMNLQICDIQALVLEVFEQLDGKALKKEIELKLEKAYEEGLYAMADPDRMMQVLINLINNAISYGHEKGWVEVALYEENDKILVEVRDNGPGIEREHLDRVFERFYRVDKSRSSKQGGSGLGLAITKHIIESHDSVITVESELGEGTVFKFSLEKA
ncbi:MAG: sensor histidine kinase [Flammeovirgaceae bacterium]